MNLRILVITHYYPPELGAGARRLESLVRGWCARGAAVKVVAPIPHYPYARRPATMLSSAAFRSSPGRFGESVVRVPYWPVAGGRGAKLFDQAVAAAFSMAPAMMRWRPTVVFNSVPTMPSMLPALASSRRWQVPLVIDMRDSWPDLIHEGRLAHGRLADTAFAFISRIQRQADAVVTVQKSFGDQLVARGLSESRVFHVPNGADLARVPVLEPVPSQRDRLQVLYLGAHGESQGLESAIRALAQLRGVAEAKFVGDGTQKAALESLARALDAPVSFRSPLQGDDVWDAYRWADTCLVPLRPWANFTDAVPSKLYEVMAVGRHVTASLQGEAVQFINETGAGLNTAPGDVDGLAAALREVAVNRDQLDVGRGPREWVERNRNRRVLAERYFEIMAAVSEAKHR